jgi:amino acid transporter
MVQTVGVGNLQAQAVENGPGLVFGALAEHWSPVVADIANVLFLTSVFAALLSFHNGVARYLYALGRERVLPSFLSRVGSRHNAPFTASLSQSLLALIVVLIFVATGSDPILQLFTWFSGMSAVGVVLLMTGTSAAVVGYFRGHPVAAGTLWQRLVAPALATVVLLALELLLIGNFNALLGTDPTSPLRWILPGIVLLAAVAGAAWGLTLRARQRSIYQGIGGTVMTPDDDEGLDEKLPSVLPRR